MRWDAALTNRTWLLCQDSSRTSLLFSSVRQVDQTRTPLFCFTLTLNSTNHVESTSSPIPMVPHQ